MQQTFPLRDHSCKCFSKRGDFGDSKQATETILIIFAAIIVSDLLTNLFF